MLMGGASFKISNFLRIPSFSTTGAVKQFQISNFSGCGDPRLCKAFIRMVNSAKPDSNFFFQFSVRTEDRRQASLEIQLQ
jgi:hypothetical protein